jgi:hypothetical protein
MPPKIGLGALWSYKKIAQAPVSIIGSSQALAEVMTLFLLKRSPVQPAINENKMKGSVKTIEIRAFKMSSLLLSVMDIAITSMAIFLNALSFSVPKKLDIAMGINRRVVDFICFAVSVVLTALI